MRQHSLVFDTDLTEKDLKEYENMPGVIGIAAYRNVLILYFQHPIGEREVSDLQAKATELARSGGAALQGQLA